MHGSILPVTMPPPPGIPPGICNFALTWWSIPHPWARRKRQFPTPGTEGQDLSPGLPGGGGVVTGKIEPCIMFACHQIAKDPFIPICFILQSIQTC